MRMRHPPPTHCLRGGLCSGRRFSLCLCRTGRAAWLDEGAVQFPVGWKHLDYHVFISVALQH